jgi:hypothetical protein
MGSDPKEFYELLVFSDNRQSEIPEILKFSFFKPKISAYVSN